MSTKTDEDGTVRYFNDEGQLHRTDGPAVEYTDGYREWWVNGEPHRTDGPAIEYTDGDREWYVNGKRHRTDGPAIEWADSARMWFENGKRHRTDGPAVEWTEGDREWWVNGRQIEQPANGHEPESAQNSQVKVVHQTTAPRYVVEARRTGSEWETEKGFNSKEDAIEDADFSQTLWPDQSFRVVDRGEL